VSAVASHCVDVKSELQRVVLCFTFLAVEGGRYINPGQIGLRYRWMYLGGARTK
jgi:hypothetical protein